MNSPMNESYNSEIGILPFSVIAEKCKLFCAAAYDRMYGILPYIETFQDSVLSDNFFSVFSISDEYCFYSALNTKTPLIRTTTSGRKFFTVAPDLSVMFRSISIEKYNPYDKHVNNNIFLMKAQVNEQTIWNIYILVQFIPNITQ